jgi:hypothetical protein
MRVIAKILCTAVIWLLLVGGSLGSLLLNGQNFTNSLFSVAVVISATIASLILVYFKVPIAWWRESVAFGISWILLMLIFIPSSYRQQQSFNRNAEAAAKWRATRSQAE